ADMMALHGVRLIPVVTKEDTYSVFGVISRSDILKARRKYLEQKNLYKKYINLSSLRRRKIDH
ncbi:MAG: hypothetical protein P4L45_06865, partial [Ignavibacteriaceae bacterium]|nr:hypothetical protein [Ignavibacteriaceae bacterium]